MCEIKNRQYTIRFAMNSIQELSDFVRVTMNEKGLSSREVSRRSNGGITYGYVNDIKNRKFANPSPKKLKALAKGLGVSDRLLLAIAAGLRQKEDEYDKSQFISLFEKYCRLKAADKKEVQTLIDMLDRELDRRLSAYPDAAASAVEKEMDARRKKSIA